MAATTRVIVPITPMKESRTAKETIRFLETNGPYPCNVPQIALPNRISVVPAASRGQNLNAAHIKNGTQSQNRTTLLLFIETERGPNTSKQTKNRTRSKEIKKL